MENVSKTDIQEFAKRSTSPKMPIERKYVEAYTDALLNSTELQKVYENIMNKVQAKDQFLLFNSYWPDASNVNSEPYRSILAYAMLKKDFFLFQLIEYNLFTGTAEKYYGADLFSEIVRRTDELPTRYTDENTFTDMDAGNIVVGFKNVYTTEVLEDGTGSQYQTQEEYEKALINFATIITMTKPARTNIIVFNIPYCFLGGDETTINTININKSDQFFTSPFGNETAMSILRDMSISILYNTYKKVTCIDPVLKISYPITYERTFKENSDNVVLSYDIRIQAPSEDVWGYINIEAGETSDKIFINATSYNPSKDYYEGYKPIMLRLNDNDEDGPVLAFEVNENEPQPTVAALLYTRFVKGD